MRYMIQFKDNVDGPWIPALFPAGVTEQEITRAFPTYQQQSAEARLLGSDNFENPDATTTWRVLSS